jgi:hypothetical protein
MDKSPAQLAIEALRKPDASLQRVPNAVRQSIADIIERQDTALKQFADPTNWHQEAGLQQWVGKRDAISFAKSVT